MNEPCQSFIQQEEETGLKSGLNEIIIMYPVHILSILSLPTLSVLLAIRFGQVKADGENGSVTLKCGDSKNLTSPNYPDNYNNNLEIHWDVLADPSQRIVVTFHDFQTEDHDALDIVDENYPSPGAKYSGSNAPTPYVSLGNHLGITFTSDFSESRTGFNLSISCFKETDDTIIHKAFGGLEHTRVMTQPVCIDVWYTDVSDTVCREAGFPGSYETNFTFDIENISVPEGINYQCNKLTFRLQDCKTSSSRCIAQDSLVIVCSVLSELGCFNLEEYTHLLSRSVKLSRDVCLTHCIALSTTPQYAVHQNRTKCSCINQTALDVTKLIQDRSRCRTNTESQTGHYATLYNVSLGFCSEPPELENGSWNNTSHGFMYGTTITAKCNDNYKLVSGDGEMRCDKATTSTTPDFVWHGTIPSCLKTNTVLLGFCSEPPELENGSWNNTSHGFMYGTTITAKCNDSYELVGGDGKMRCDNATTSTTQDFEWHGTNSSCLKKNTETSGSKTLWISIGVLIPVIIIIVIFACFILWIKRQKAKKGESLCLLALGDIQQRVCQIICFLWGVSGGTRPTSTESRRGDPGEQEPCSPKDTSRFHPTDGIYFPKISNTVPFLPSIPKFLEYLEV